MKALAIAVLLFAAPAYAATPDEIALAIAIKEAELRLTPAPEQAGTAPASPPPAPAIVNSEGHPAERRVAVPARGGFLTAADLTPDQQPTPMAGVSAGLNALGPLASKRLVVYGSGFDARWEITAARREPTLTVVGIEIDPKIAASARLYVAEAGLSGRITIQTGDAIAANVQADLGVAYLWPETLAQLAPKIKQLQRFVSFAHAVPGLSMQQSGDVFVYQRRPLALPGVAPQNAAPAVTQVPVYANVRGTATWNGREYSHRQCSNPRCAMCRAIESQLAASSRQVVGYRTVPVQPQAAPVQQAQPSGHWVTRKVCQNGRCSMVRTWVPN